MSLKSEEKEEQEKEEDQKQEQQTVLDVLIMVFQTVKAAVKQKNTEKQCDTYR